MKRIFSCLLLSAVLLSALSCGGKQQEMPPADNAQQTPATVQYNFADCPVIYSAAANDNVVKYAQRVKTQLRAAILQDVPFETDGVAAADKEILVGDTNRPESASVKAKLPAGAGHAYRIELVGEKFVIVATDDLALERGVQCFIYDVISEIREMTVELSADFSYSDTFGVDTILFSNGAQIKTQMISTIYGPTASRQSPDLSYARIIELAHNGEYNGVLIATSESLDVDKYLIHRSTDFGETWETVGEVFAQMKDMVANWQPMLYELPCRVGDMPEGTLLLAGCIRNANTTKTNMVIYKSSDFGASWKIVSTVASGGGFSQTGGLSTGLWEPFLICDDSGKLYCFYSDETDAQNHSQMIVCRSSTDGVNWSETQVVTAAADPNLRPGMPTVTRLGDGRYFITYEMIGQTNVPIYCKTTDDLSDWGDPANLGTVVATRKGEGVGSAPYCSWIPAGGEQGTLVVTAAFNYNETDEKAADLLVSFDYGKTWTVMDSPLSYETTVEARYSYSPGFFTSSDGKKLFFVNTVPSEVVPGKRDLKLAVLEISAFGGVQ